MKKILGLLFIFPFYSFGQSFALNEIFIGELTGNVQTEPVYLGDSVVFSLQPGQRFLARYAGLKDDAFSVTLPDGRNGAVKTEHVKKSADQSLFKFSYPYNFFPFTGDFTIYVQSAYSNCNYSAVIYWQEYFKDTTDFAGLSLRAYNKDTSALFLLLREPFLDSDGSGQWSFNNWKIINSYTDQELARIMINRDRTGRRAMEYGLYPDVTESPFGEETGLLDLYYATWYPLTWKIITFERLNEREDKAYAKKYKVLKKEILGSK